MQTIRELREGRTKSFYREVTPPIICITYFSYMYINNTFCSLNSLYTIITYCNIIKENISASSKKLLIKMCLNYKLVCDLGYKEVHICIH